MSELAGLTAAAAAAPLAFVGLLVEAAAAASFAFELRVWMGLTRSTEAR